MIVTDERGVPLAFNATSEDVPGYSPKQLRAAYAVSGVASGQPIIGIVDAYLDPTALSDLKIYSRHFKLPVLPKCHGDVASSPVPCLEIVNQRGGHKLPTTVVGEWADEQSIDLQLAHALCENCSILLVEADSNGLGDLFPSENTAARLGANVISNSWGTADLSGDASADAQFFTHPGIVMTAGTGDHGYAHCLCPSRTVFTILKRPNSETGSHAARDWFDGAQFGRVRPSAFHCAGQLGGKAMRRVAPIPHGSRPATAASTMAGSRNASEIVIWTDRVLRLSRAAMSLASVALPASSS